MINLGEVHCHWCGDAFEPEGIPSIDGPNFCSDRCEGEHISDMEAYLNARYGSAVVFE